MVLPGQCLYRSPTSKSSKYRPNVRASPIVPPQARSGTSFAASLGGRVPDGPRGGELPGERSPDVPLGRHARAPVGSGALVEVHGDALPAGDGDRLLRLPAERAPLGPLLEAIPAGLALGLDHRRVDGLPRLVLDRHGDVVLVRAREELDTPQSVLAAALGDALPAETERRHRVGLGGGPAR